VIDGGELRWRGGRRSSGVVDGGVDVDVAGASGLEACPSEKGLDVGREEGGETNGFPLWCD